jgi:PAS domain S-box-containing protein
MVGWRMAKVSPMTTRVTQTHLDFSTLLGHVTNYAVFIVDIAGNITNWNQGAQDIMGWQRDEVIGKYFDFLYGDVNIRSRKPDKDLQQALKKGTY